VNPWDRQPGESGKAFEAFAIYRDLGPSRTILEVARRLSKSRQLLTRWAKKHRWHERAAAYDLYLDSIVQKAEEERKRRLADQRAKIAEAALSLVALNLAKLLQQARDPGAPPERMQAVARLLEAASRVIGDESDRGALEVLVRYVEEERGSAPAPPPGTGGRAEEGASVQRHRVREKVGQDDAGD